MDRRRDARRTAPRRTLRRSCASRPGYAIAHLITAGSVLGPLYWKPQGPLQAVARIGGVAAPGQRRSGADMVQIRPAHAEAPATRSADHVGGSSLPAGRTAFRLVSHLDV